MTRIVRAVALFLLALPGVAMAAIGPDGKTEYVTARLVSEASVVAPGQPFFVALEKEIVPGWHTYWTNPGDSGYPTTIAWDLPPGWVAGPLLYPAPDAIPVGPLTNYGFEGSFALPQQITPAADAPPGPVTLRAKAGWLVCEEICIPEEVELSLLLTVGPAPQTDAAGSARVGAARAALPEPAPFAATYQASDDRFTLIAEGEGLDPATAGAAQFFPATAGVLAHAAPQTLAGTPDRLTLTATRDVPDPLTEVPGVLVFEREGTRRAFALVARPADGPAPPPAAAPTDPAAGAPGGTAGAAPPQTSGPAAGIGSGPSPTTPRSETPLDVAGVLGLLGLAVLGGAILNLMPCVFPVLAIKAQALLRTGGDRRHAAIHAAGYTAGILATFLTLAAALLALQAGGASVGWGFQLQSPAFVAFLIFLFFGMGLSLSGLFTVGSGLMNVGSGLAGRGGLTGSLATGALAVLVAAPCIGPFLGPVMGAALAAEAPPALTLATFIALGLGLAAPFVALSLSPGLIRRMPRPGPWMERLKQFLAFPMYATAGFLVYVLAGLAGTDAVAAAGFGLTALAMAAWLWGLAGRSAGRSALIGRGAALLALAGAVGVTTLALRPEAAVEPWSQARLDALRAAGRPVFVNMTADWCVQCKANEINTLGREEVRAAFAAADMTYLEGDWTRGDAAITAFLKTYGRAGVPLYVIYPVGGGEGRVLPQVLTIETVVEEIRRAGDGTGA